MTEKAPDDEVCMSAACHAGNHDGCRDVEGNCCDCSCHLGLKWGLKPAPDDVWQIVQAYLEKCDAQLMQIRNGLEQAHRDLLALIARAEENEQKREKITGPTPSFTCPRCGKTSYHPEDVKQGYCGNCHEFTGEKTNARFQA